MKRRLLSIFILFFASLMPLWADSTHLLSEKEREYLKEKKVLKFHAEKDWEPYNFTKDGVATGFVNDLVRVMTKPFPIDVEFIKGYSWDEYITMLERGDIDVISNIAYTEQRSEHFAYTKNPIFTIKMSILSQKNYNSLEELAGKKVGVIEGYYTEGIIKSKYKEIETLSFESTNALLEALLNGKVDAIIEDYGVLSYMINELLLTTKLYNNIILDSEFTKKLYMAVNKDDTLLASLLDKMIKNIPNDKLAKLRAIWGVGAENQSSSNQKLSLSEDEKAFLKDKTFNLCAKNNHYPLCDVENKKVVGIAGDVLGKLKSELGVEFKLIESKTYKEIHQQILDGECEVVIPMKQDQTLFSNIKTTTPIFETYFVSIGNKDSVYLDYYTDFDKHTFYVKNNSHKKEIEKVYPELNIEALEDIDSIMDRVKDSPFVHFLEVALVAEYTIQNYGYDEYKIDGQLSRVPIKGAIGVKSSYPLLLSSIDKVLHNMGSKELGAIIRKHELKEFTVVRDNEYLWYLLIGLLFIIGVLFYRYYIISVKNREIKNEQAKFKYLLENSSDGVHIIDLSGKLLYYSNSFAHMLGYTKDEMDGLNVSDWDMDIQKEDIYPMIKELIKTPKTFETRHKRKDGSIYYAQINAKGIEIDDKNYLYNSIRDITQRKEYEKLLEESEKRLRYALEGVGDGLWDWQMDTNEVYFSKSWKAMLGFKDDEITGSLEEWKRRVHPEHIEQCFIDIKKHLDGETPIYINEHQVLCKDGSYKWILDRGVVVERDSSGRPTRMIGTHTDINEQVELRLEQRNSALKLELATSATKQGIWSWDFENDILEWDDNMYRIFDVEKRDDISRYETWRNAVLKEDLPKAEEKLYKAIQSGGVFEDVFRIEHKNGDIRYIQAAALCQFDKSGKKIAMVETNIDITDLELAKQKAQKASLAKSEFLANMSHEIRTPLNGIIGLTDIVLDTPLNDMQREYLTKAKLSSSSLLSIINDILDYSKIEAGKLDIIKERFSLSDMVSDISSIFGFRIDEKGLLFRFSIDPDISDSIVGDKLRILQVLNNFMGNAIKFTDKGSVHIDIKLIFKDEKRQKLCFSIKDTGIGIAKENQQKLFESFNQEDSSTTKKYGGTGLGLAISKHLVELMDGKVFFESQKGAGSTFGFELELEYVESSSASEDLSLQKPKDGKMKLKEGKKVLIAEDNETNQIVAKKTFEGLGFEVDIAEDGLQALKRAKEGSYDLILMDLQMPNMDGYEATRKIREFNTTIPIIALSAAVMERDIELAKKAGMNTHLSKPINKDELYRVISSEFETTLTSSEEKIPDESKGTEIYGVDIEELLEDFEEMEDVFSILLMFKKSYENIELLKIEDRDELKKFVHKLKGASGNIYIKRVYELAKSAEEEELSKSSLERLECELKKVCKDIGEKALKQQSKGEVLELEKLVSFIDRMVLELEKSHLIKRDEYESLLDALSSYIDESEVVLLRDMFENFGYDEVIKSLVLIKNRLQKDGK